MNRDKWMLGVLLVLIQNIFAQAIEGKWKTIDDQTGKAKAIVEVYTKGSKIYGKVVKILNKKRENALCTKCDGDLKNAPILGIKVIDGLEKVDDLEYKGKTILEPEKGLSVRGKVWLDPDEPDKLFVRGYIAFLYRTQTWLRLKE